MTPYYCIQVSILACRENKRVCSDANLHRCSFSWKQHIFLLLAWSCPETLDLEDLSHKSIWWALQEVQTFAKFWPYLEFQFPFSPCSKHFCFVSEQNKTEERDFGFGRMRIRTRTKKMKEGEGEGRKPYLTFLLQPLLALLLMPFFSFLLLRSETAQKHLERWVYLELTGPLANLV